MNFVYIFFFNLCNVVLSFIYLIIIFSILFKVLLELGKKLTAFSWFKVEEILAKEDFFLDEDSISEETNFFSIGTDQEDHF